MVLIPIGKIEVLKSATHTWGAHSGFLSGLSLFEGGYSRALVGIQYTMLPLRILIRSVLMPCEVSALEPYYKGHFQTLRSVVSEQHKGTSVKDLEPEPQPSAADVEERKRSIVKAFMSAQLGDEKAHLAQLLQQHGVLVKGGAEEGRKLLEALIEWKNNEKLS
ncbi:hypothetical protein CEUSTIGMA_g10551.t1 [Chlamydomonas eustigma]|uniref:Uncharacterized protein n=1 Tax=Chlamydomonas eustigma TaxID=1157962 RepID=A0A250XJ65_9CHLO|nr:hypothetical protein CEUSTIGMA_g10551.t1 [Chlamydomonas eustigma]|eukprot:GAX83125.1 hypothetical protein CEUSTIGMA_g10551.t1 [Chlamydomonas eustigma]